MNFLLLEDRTQNVISYNVFHTYHFNFIYNSFDYLIDLTSNHQNPLETFVSKKIKIKIFFSDTTIISKCSFYFHYYNFQ